MSKQVQQMRRMLLILDKLKRPGQVSKQELLDVVEGSAGCVSNE